MEDLKPPSPFVPLYHPQMPLGQGRMQGTGGGAAVPLGLPVLMYLRQRGRDAAFVVRRGKIASKCHHFTSGNRFHWDGALRQIGVFSSPTVP